MNVINQLFDSYCRWVAAWDARSSSLIVHAALLLAVPTAMCVFAFRAGSRAPAIQVLTAVVGVLFAAGIQMERRMPASPVGLAWAVTLSLVLLLILPRGLAFLIARRRGTQRILSLLFYLGLLGLLLANLAWKGRP